MQLQGKRIKNSMCATYFVIATCSNGRSFSLNSSYHSGTDF